MKRVIGFLKQLEGSPRAELLCQRLQELGIRERITSSLQKQHRNFHLEQVICTLI
jgi:hypothetical protein